MGEKLKIWLGKVCLVPQRYLLGMMSLICIMSAYSMRNCLSVAIIEMVEKASAMNITDPDACNYSASDKASAHEQISTKIYPWTEQDQGLILSSFYWGYVIFHLPAGWLAEVYGAKWCLLGGMGLNVLIVFITPVCINLSTGSIALLVTLRVIMGAAQGTVYPGINCLIAHWVPKQERSVLGTIMLMGYLFGTILSNGVSGILILRSRMWSSVFYFFGSLGFVWCLLFFFLCYSTPVSHPFLSDKEREYLEENVEGIAKSIHGTPWKAILTSKPLWALVCMQCGHDYGQYMLLTNLPKYMNDVLKFNIQDNGLLSALPFVTTCFTSLIMAWICDWMIKKQVFSVTITRKIFSVIAQAGPAIFLILASYAGCNRAFAVAMFTMTMAMMGGYFCGFKINPAELSPNYAGMMMAITNGAGAITGFLAPYIVGLLTPNRRLKEWRLAFWIAFIIFMATTVVFIIWGTSEIQPFNDPDYNKPKGDNAE